VEPEFMLTAHPPVKETAESVDHETPRPYIMDGLRNVSTINVVRR
jgi:hypothetical protein